MKALTIHQPWAAAIMAGVKRVENRTWFTNTRGRLAIHAGLSIDPAGEELLARAGVELPQAVEDLPGGVVLGTVELVDLVRYPSPGAKQRTLGPEFGDEDPYALAGDPLASGPWCWVLRNPRKWARPVPCKGKQGLWEFRSDGHWMIDEVGSDGRGSRAEARGRRGERRK